MRLQEEASPSLPRPAPPRPAHCLMVSIEMPTLCFRVSEASRESCGVWGFHYSRVLFSNVLPPSCTAIALQAAFGYLKVERREAAWRSGGLPCQLS